MARSLQSEQQILRAFDNQLRKLKEKARAAARKEGRVALAVMRKLYATEQYAGETGAIRPLGHITIGWIQAKQKLRLDARRGHAGLGISKAFAKSFIVTAKGFDIDLRLGSLGVIGRKGRRKTVAPVSRYLDFYEQRKAPGLGSIPAENATLIRDVAVKTLDDGLKTLRKSAARLAGKGRSIELVLGRILTA